MFKEYKYSTALQANNIFTGFNAGFVDEGKCKTL